MTEAGIYRRGMSKPRLYVSREEMGHGVLCVREEYGIEVLRLITHYAWTNDNNTKTIIEQDKKIAKSMTNRMMKAFKEESQLKRLRE